MKKSTLTLLSICCTMFALAQTIKIDNGIAINHLKGTPDIYSTATGSYSGMLGIEYLEHPRFYLSSGLGYLRQGGRSGLMLIDGVGSRTTESWSYVQANTTFRARVMVSKLELFAGAGPYLHVLAGSDKMKETLLNQYGYHAASTSWGGRLEAGFSETAGRWKAGVYAAYLLPFSPTLKAPATDWDARTLGVYLSIGYRLQ